MSRTPFCPYVSRTRFCPPGTYSILPTWHTPISPYKSPGAFFDDQFDKQHTIIAGNVVSNEMTEELILNGESHCTHSSEGPILPTFHTPFPPYV